MAVYTDQTGRQVNIVSRPVRIISIVPSQTELLYDLGLDKEVTGITKFCIHPDSWFRQKTRVGGTKKLHTELIKSLQPDLILANKEENTKEQVEELAEYFPVWISDIKDLDGAIEMIRSVGAITGKQPQADHLATTIRENFDAISIPAKRKACYLIWKDPYMTVGGDCFISNMMDYAGFENVFAKESRYPVIELDALREVQCEFILLSSEPYPFRQKHVEEIGRICPGMKIITVDGELFSWYGSRLLKTPGYFKQLNQQLHVQ